jgi:hypothetical protein
MLGRVRKEAVVVYFNRLSQNINERSKENHNKPQAASLLDETGIRDIPIKNLNCKGPHSDGVWRINTIKHYAVTVINIKFA